MMRSIASIVVRPVTVAARIVLSRNTRTDLALTSADTAARQALVVAPIARMVNMKSDHAKVSDVGRLALHGAPARDILRAFA